jgi:DNA modification methylase
VSKTHLQIDPSHSYEIPTELAEHDSRYPDAVVEVFLEEFTKPGDVVLDPFSGFGTTLLVAERMKREAYGIEIDKERHKFAASLLAHPERLIAGDSRELERYEFPEIDFSISSPPYRIQERGNPLSAYREDGIAYGEYLDFLKDIYGQMARKMKLGAYAVIKVSNLKERTGVLPLAWDMAKHVGQVMAFEGERVLCWERFKHGYHHSYALVFRNLG